MTIRRLIMSVKHPVACPRQGSAKFLLCPGTHHEGRRSLRFVTEQAHDSGAMSVSAVTSAVTTSFAFGWQMARLYNGPLSSAVEPKLERDLPGLSALPA